VLYLSTQELQTGLFSAAVATLLSLAIPTLQPSSQDTSAFYLASIYQLLSQENGSQVLIPPSLSNPAASFTPPAAAVWVNSLWFLSLAISLTCALLSTLLQQWARRYLRLTKPRCSPHKRARIRSFFAEGVERLHLPWAVEALPTLLHVSLFLFFAGLCVFLFGIHQTVFSVVMAWVGLCVVVYTYVTALPILYKDSPYHAPLSTFVWFCITSARHGYPRRNSTMPGSFPTRDTEQDRDRNPSPHSLHKMAQEYASTQSAEIDYRALSWTFESLDEDHELEKFFEGVPGFCNSSAVDRPVEGFIKPNDRKLSNTLTGLMDRTLTSSLVPELTKQRRITICTKAISAANLFGPWWILDRVLLGKWDAFLKSIDFGLFLKDWSRVDRPITTFYAQCAVAAIISSVQTQARDDRWFQLVTRQIDNVSKYVLRSYLPHGDSIQLANLIYIVQQTLRTSSEIGEHYETHIKDASLKTLESMCKLDARNSLPELQRDFCKLWNELVLVAGHDGPRYVHNLSLGTLKNIRKVYIALHEGTNALPIGFTTTDDSDDALDDITSYPICWHKSTLPGGPPDLHGPATQPLVTLPPAVPPPHVSLSSTTLIPFPTPPASSVPTTASPVHQSVRPTDLYFSAQHASCISTSTASSFPVPQTFPSADPHAKPDPREDAYDSKPSFPVPQTFPSADAYDSKPPFS
jgi:hypothetical protein